MERLIERRIIDALRNREQLETGHSDYAPYRDVVRVLVNGSVLLKLHGHTIGKYDAVYKDFTLCTCGYETRTTKSRLNCFSKAFGLGVSFVIRKGVITPIGELPGNVRFYNR